MSYFFTNDGHINISRYKVFALNVNLSPISSFSDDDFDDNSFNFEHDYYKIFVSIKYFQWQYCFQCLGHGIY
jgi:hypothetical protein